MEKGMEERIEKDIEEALAIVIANQHDDIHHETRKRYQSNLLKLNAKVALLKRFGWCIESIRVKRCECTAKTKNNEGTCKKSK